MKRFIYSITIPVLFFIFFTCGCQHKDRKARKAAAKAGEQKFIENKPVSDTILLVSMAFNETYLIESIKNKVTSFYHIPVKCIVEKLPPSAFFKPRNRFRADLLLNYLKTVNNGKYRFVAGLTSKDISCTSGSIPDWGVFGLGTLSGKECITSSFRLKKNASCALLTERIQKVVLHEIGHNHRLDHCISPYPCFMKAANGKISEVDSDPMEMCSQCRKKANL
jgi:archaemetzincin